MEMATGTKGNDGDDVVTATVSEGHFFGIPDPENRSPAIQETLDFAGFDGYILLDPYTGVLRASPILQVGSPLERSQTQNGTLNHLLFDFLKDLHTENSRHNTSNMTCFITFLGTGCFLFLILPYISYIVAYSEPRRHYNVDLWLLVRCYCVASYFVLLAQGALKDVSKTQERLKQFLQRQENAYGIISKNDNLSSHQPRHHICEYYRLEYRPNPMVANSSQRTSCMTLYQRCDYIFFVRKTGPLQKKLAEKAEFSTLVGSSSKNKTASTSTHNVPNQLHSPIVVDAEDCENSCGGTSGQCLLPVGQVDISANFINIIQAMPMNQGPWKEFCAEYQDLFALKDRMHWMVCAVFRACVVLAFMGGGHLTYTLWLWTAVSMMISISICVRTEKIYVEWFVMQLKLINHRHRDDPTHICGIMDVSVILNVRANCTRTGTKGLMHLLSFRHFPREPADQVVLHDMPPLRPSLVANLDRLSLWDLLVPSRDYWEQLEEWYPTRKEGPDGSFRAT